MGRASITLQHKETSLNPALALLIVEMVDSLGHWSKCSLPHSHFLCCHATLIARGVGGGGGWLGEA